MVSPAVCGFGLLFLCLPRDKFNTIGDCKVASVVHKRPHRFRAWVNPIGAERHTRLPGSDYEVLGTPGIQVHSVDPMARGILRGQAESPGPEMQMVHFLPIRG